MPQNTATEPIRLTAAGQRQLQDELTLLRDEHRPSLLAAGRRARLLLAPGLGAAAIHNVESDLLLTERRIAELEAILARVHIIPEGPAPSAADMGTAVTVRYEDGTEETVTLVDPLEADPRRGLVSMAAPLAQAVHGKRPGETATAGTGEHAVQLTVTKVGKPPAHPAAAARPAGGR